MSTILHSAGQSQVFIKCPASRKIRRMSRGILIMADHHFYRQSSVFCHRNAIIGDILRNKNKLLMQYAVYVQLSSASLTIPLFAFEKIAAMPPKQWKMCFHKMASVPRKEAIVPCFFIYVICPSKNVSQVDTYI